MFAASTFFGTRALAEQVDDNNYGLRDLYVFESQEDADRIVLAMTLDSLEAGLLYEFKIDSNDDAIEDKVVQVTVAGSGEHQQITVHGPAAPETTGGHGLVVPGPTLAGDVSTADSPLVIAHPGYPVCAFAGLRDDPTKADGSNVTALVVEVRKDAVVAEGTPIINVWATVSRVGGAK